MRLIPSMEGFIAAAAVLLSLSLFLSFSLSLSLAIFASADAAYVLAFSIIMLATDLHSTQVSKSLDTLVKYCIYTTCTFSFCTSLYIISIFRISLYTNIIFGYLCILMSYFSGKA